MRTIARTLKRQKASSYGGLVKRNVYTYSWLKERNIQIYVMMKRKMGKAAKVNTRVTEGD